MKLPMPPRPLPELHVLIQGEHTGSYCRVAVWRLVDYMDGLTFKHAQRWARAALEGERRCNQKRVSCLR
jgi:hypothetical protein